MPYICRSERAALDLAGVTRICALIEERDKSTAAGDVTYVVMRLMVALCGGRRRFWLMALAGGAVLFAILEFYRRITGPYENEKLLENGDVDECNELTHQTPEIAPALH